jgi:indole-3-glycerol phosphate synthase
MNIASSSSKMSLAAEFKRASPSKGDINVHVDIIEQVMMIDDDDDDDIDHNANDDDDGDGG